MRRIRVLFFVVSLLLLQLLTGGLNAAAGPGPEFPPPAIYGWLRYTDGSPVPAGTVVRAVGCGYTWETATGDGVLYDNAYMLVLDIPGEDENCDVTLEVDAGGYAVELWLGHVVAGDILNVNGTIPRPPQPGQGSSVEANGSIEQLSAMLEGDVGILPVTPGDDSGSDSGGSVWAYAGAGAAVGLAVLFLVRKR